MPLELFKPPMVSTKTSTSKLIPYLFCNVQTFSLFLNLHLTRNMLCWFSSSIHIVKSFFTCSMRLLLVQLVLVVHNGVTLCALAWIMSALPCIVLMVMGGRPRALPMYTLVCQHLNYSKNIISF